MVIEQDGLKTGSPRRLFQTNSRVIRGPSVSCDDVYRDLLGSCLNVECTFKDKHSISGRLVLDGVYFNCSSRTRAPHSLESKFDVDSILLGRKGGSDYRPSCVCLFI